MCGRLQQQNTAALREYLREKYGMTDADLEKHYGVPRYNFSPSQACPVIVNDDGDVLPVPMEMRWGLVPFWDKSEKPKIAPINAQAETVTEKATFRQSAQKRRCLVPADGFYEWLRIDEKTKFAFDIHLRGRRPFVVAAIYEKATETRPATFAVLTTRPNELMSKIHDRMPAILDDQEARRWLAPGPLTPQQVADLTAPHAAEDMEAIPISALVNSPRNDVPEILEAIAFQMPPRPPPKPIQAELF